MHQIQRMEAEDWEGEFRLRSMFLRGRSLLECGWCRRYCGRSPNVDSPGWNGGGTGSAYSSYGGGGGGASDVRISASLTDRIVVAGGGGGANGYTGYSNNNGGAGGDLTGGNGVYGSSDFSASYCGSGGSQTAGGVSVTYETPATASGLGNGASSYTNYYGAGGGGGYYGGGAGSYYGAGGGGSNYVSSTGITNIIRTQGYQPGNGQIIISWSSIACISSRSGAQVTMSGSPVLSSVTATPATINCGSGSSLSATSAGNVIRWWNAATGGSLLATSGSGAGYSVSPLSTTVYYAESFLNPCVSLRVADTLTVLSIPPPASVTALPGNLSCGTSTNIYGTTTSGIIRWWDLPAGGNLTGTTQSGIFLNLLPLSTTTYYAETYNYISGSQTFAYTGSQQTWIVPSGINTVNVDVSGAQGGNASNTTYGTGGLGGRVQAAINVTPAQILYFYIGGAGGTVGGGAYVYSPGWNGGGTGSSYSSGYYGGGGGGGSDIRISTSLTDRIIVAGGGGGANGYNSYTNNNGGAGGDLTGGNGVYGTTNFSTIYCGSGGTQTAGGASATDYTPASASGFGFGAHHLPALMVLEEGEVIMVVEREAGMVQVEVEAIIQQLRGFQILYVPRDINQATGR